MNRPCEPVHSIAGMILARPALTNSTGEQRAFSGP